MIRKITTNSPAWPEINEADVDLYLTSWLACRVGLVCYRMLCVVEAESSAIVVLVRPCWLSTGVLLVKGGENASGVILAREGSKAVCCTSIWVSDTARLPV